ncbi:hypothetical protein Plec18167_002108 [Paecilomyces lecythidis]|uniref:PLD phosphodiesterase domain-containing protein n=1 Tax=Paecilomyces lecythidis TaxID=3004212 RepID=A0ABR3Y9P1_9EURO
MVSIAHQPKSVNHSRCANVPPRVYDLCHSNKNVTSELEEHPTESPGHIAHKLFQHDEAIKEDIAGPIKDVGDKDDALERAYECGIWGSSRPSDLFLKIYHDALCTLEKNPLAGVVSPSLMGSRGVVPLTIIAPLPDLCRHISNCIVRAEKEIFLGTNFWIYSDASTLVTDAFRELSRRAGERGEKVVVKMLYDRGNLKQASLGNREYSKPMMSDSVKVYDNHQRVSAKEYTSAKVQLPPPEEIPNIDLELINYHRPMLGTFHCKFVIFDRRVALLQSSNIQDNDNLEMMIRVEGPVVDSFYDMALISWHKSLNPPLPMLGSPASEATIPSFSREQSYTGSETEQTGPLPEHTTKDPHYDPDISSEAKRVNGTVEPRPGETRTQAVTRHLNTTIQPNTTGDAPDSDQDIPMRPYVQHKLHDPFPMAMVNREPWGAPNHSSVHTPQNAAFISAISNARRSIFIQTPNMNAEPILDPLLDAVRRGVIVTAYLCLGYNDAGELLPFQNGTNEMIANRLYKSLATDEERSRLRIHYYIGKDQTKPIHNSFKSRSCHVKLMIIDEKVAIQGNGNLDTQSFYHSQEINLLLDSPLICRDWLDQINRNQNTATYGLVSAEDGCWHDPVTGELPKNSVGMNPGRFSWAKGVIGAIKRVQGAGGF